jgi:hypothetical protein
VATVQLPAQTPIYSLPFFILFPAKYRLAKDLTYEGRDGSAIMVLSSNVDLDLNGCALEDAAADNQSIGILVDHQQNVTIRNGKIRGFKQPIVFDDHTKRVTWPGNDLASGDVTVQSVEASKELPVDAKKSRRHKPHPNCRRLLRARLPLPRPRVNSWTDTTPLRVHRKLLLVQRTIGTGRNSSERQRKLGEPTMGSRLTVRHFTTSALARQGCRTVSPYLGIHPHCNSRAALLIGAVFSAPSTNWSKS